MNILFKTPERESKRTLLPLLLTSCLLLSGTAVIAAESAGLHSYQSLPTQSITMPQISNWQDANTRVKKLGGWMFYASEADAAVSEQPAKHDSKQHSKHHHHADKTPKAVKDQP